MLKIAMGIGALYAICWIVSTPESRAAMQGPVNRFGRALFAVVYGFIGLLWLVSMVIPQSADPGADSIGEHGPP